jgi:hypothetical protein
MIDKSRFANITIGRVSNFLTSKGWTFTASESKWNSVFSSPADAEGNHLTIILPKHESADDYYLRLRNAINIYTEFANISESELIKDLSTIYEYNTLLIILKVKEASLPLTYAAQVTDAIKNLLYHGAANEFLPRPFISGKQPIASSFVNSCKFQQTITGSFGFQIELHSPPISQDRAKDDGINAEKILKDKSLDATNNDLELVSNKTFETRVLRRVVKGLQSVQTAVNDKSDTPIVDAFEQGFNANMCNDILNMLTMIKAPVVEFRPKWSERVTLHDRSLSDSFAITEQSKKFLEMASSKMRAAANSSEYIEFIGEVKELRHHTTKDELDMLQRELRIILEGKDNNGKFRNIRAFLEPDMYALACDAHKEKRSLKITGQLTKIRSAWYLEKISNFEVL